MFLPVTLITIQRHFRNHDIYVYPLLLQQPQDSVSQFPYGVIHCPAHGSITVLLGYHKRDVRFDTLITDLSVYMESYFDELKMSIDTLQPLTLNSCEEVSAALTSRAAFSINVRAFLLVRDKTPTALPPPAR